MNDPDPKAEERPDDLVPPSGAGETADQVEKAKKSAEDSGVTDVVSDVVGGVCDVVFDGVLSIFDV